MVVKSLMNNYTVYYTKYTEILLAIARESDSMVDEGFYMFWLTGMEPFAATMTNLCIPPEKAGLAWKRHVERRRAHALSRDRLSIPMFLWDGEKWELRRW